MLPLQLLGDKDEGCLAGANPTIERYFHDCVYDTRDLIGFYFGLMSISCWMVAQVPQLITNYHRQSAEALSAFFLAQWLLGDTCNLLGALLKGDQPETVILTAQYFICMDAVLLLQYLYYTAVARRLERTYVLAARRHHRHHGHHHGHHRHHSHRHHQRGSNRRDGLSNDNSGEANAVADDGNTNRSTTEIESSSGVVAVNMLQNSNEGENTGLNSERRPRVLAGAAATGVITIAGSLGIFVSFNNASSSSSPSFSIADAFLLLTHRFEGWQQFTGSILGYISCVLYLASRISQILKNSQRQSAEGLASSMFLFAAAANLFYGASVLMRSRTKKEMISSFPWVLGSLGTVVLDGIILIQTVIFTKLERKNTSGIGNAIAGAGTSAAMANRSDIEQPLLEELSAEHPS